MVDLTDKQKVEESIERALCGSSAELHLQQYPVFHLTPNKPTDTRITFSETIRQNGATLRREWSVQVHPATGWPGEHEAEVWRAIEHIVHLRKESGKLTNPFVTSLSEIRRHMSGRGRGGVDLERIRTALFCLQNTVIRTSFFYYSGDKIEKELTFCLIAEVGRRARILSNGEKIMDTVTIHIPEKLFENISNRYVRPLDKGFRDDLDKWIAKRLYEMLGVKFFGLRKKREPYRTRYSRLCGLIGITRQHYLSRARQVLGRAHHELELKGFLHKVEWYPVRHDRNDWVLAYWPGQRAQAEWNKDFWREAEVSEPLFVEILPDIESEPVWVDELRSDETPITVEIASDEPEQGLLPFVQELPSAAGPSELWPAEHSPEATSEASARQQGEASEDYAKMALQAFESATGKSRRLARLSKAEREHLIEWQVSGITAADIRCGTREALVIAERQARESGKKPREILSLAYVAGHVSDAAADRLLREEREQTALDYLLAHRDPEVAEVEEQVKQWLASMFPNAVHRSFIADLYLAELSESQTVLLALEQEQVPVVAKLWKERIGKLLGRGTEVYWIVDWVYGPDWQRPAAKARSSSAKPKRRGT
jgi:hypothetical protein